MSKKKQISLLQRIASNSDRFSPKQLQLAHFIEKNYASLAYTTMTELAHLAAVSETTVVRFVYQLGYQGFPEFKNALRDTIEQATKPSAAMNRYALESQEYVFPQDTAKAIFSVEMHVMQETLALLNTDELQKAIDMLASAPAVIVLACGANTCCSQALGFALQVIRPGVHIIEKAGISEGSLIRSLPDGTICVAFTTPRYPTETQEILEMLKDKNIRIIGISDSLLSPMAAFSEIFFQVPMKYVTFIDTNAAFMAIIHSLIFGLQMKDKRRAKKEIDGYNDFTLKQNYYVNDYLELVDI